MAQCFDAPGPRNSLCQFNRYPSTNGKNNSPESELLEEKFEKNIVVRRGKKSLKNRADKSSTNEITNEITNCKSSTNEKGATENP